MDAFKLLTRTANLSVYRCPQCFNEFASTRKAPKCPRCKFPEKGSDFELQLKRAKSEIRAIVGEKGYILAASELRPLIESLMSDFPKTQWVDILGRLELDRDRIRRERYDLDLHQYVEEKLRSGHDREEKPRRTLEQALSEEESTEDYILLLLERHRKSRHDRYLLTK